MAARKVLKPFLWLLSFPHIAVSLLLEIFKAKKIQLDLERCLVLVDRYGTSVPSVFVQALVLAEDHRSGLHPGIDAIAIARAIWVKIRHGQSQGASTIEQQYVRVVTNRYERTVHRKIREQLIALMLSRRVNKDLIASSYLSIAFYGAGMRGLQGLKARFGEDLARTPFHQALLLVLQLKYPRPEEAGDYWERKILVRFNELLRRDNIPLARNE